MRDRRARAALAGAAAYLFWLALSLATLAVYMAGSGRVGAFRYAGF